LKVGREKNNLLNARGALARTQTNKVPPDPVGGQSVNENKTWRFKRPQGSTSKEQVIENHH